MMLDSKLLLRALERRLLKLLYNWKAVIDRRTIKEIAIVAFIGQRRVEILLPAFMMFTYSWRDAGADKSLPRKGAEPASNSETAEGKYDL